MEDLTFAFITPSYAPDFERCKLLCWSIKQFVFPKIKHYIIVDRQDFSLFQTLADANTTILIKEDILPNWIKRVPFSNKKNIWLNLKGFQSGSWLIRGWLIQQIIKLAAAQYIEQDVLVFLDSDVAFIDKFNVHEMVQASDSKVRLFRVPNVPQLDNKVTQKWKNTAKALLGLPQDQVYHDNYISQIMTWRRDTLMALYKAIERQTGKPWINALTEVKDLSEYVLYGMFVSYVLKDEAGHYEEHMMKLCHSYWSEKKMSSQQLADFFQQAVSSGHKAVMISAKSPTLLSIEQFQQQLAMAK
ncbi:MAG: DUF6492 family protein [Elainellaceae cyanobacterium]